MTAIVVLGTIGSYLLADRIAGRLGRPAIAAPVLWSSVLLVVALALLGLEAPEYVRHAGPLRWLLAPATVALGVPLARAIRRLEHRRSGARVAFAILAGGLATSAAAGLVAASLGAPPEEVAVATAKSISAPIALAVDLPVEADDGLLAAACVVTGVYGAVLLPWLARRLSLDGEQSLGAGIGVTAHAIGSAEVARRRPESVGWAAAGLALNGVFTALWLPLVLRFVLT